MYRVFKRRFWKDNPQWPNGLEPHLGRKTTIGYARTEEEAREMCEEYNENNDPGRYSLKAEYEKA